MLMDYRIESRDAANLLKTNINTTKELLSQTGYDDLHTTNTHHQHPFVPPGR